jgi:hypothetical protein
MPSALPKPLFSFFLLLPLEEQETSYLAASARIESFSSTRSFIYKITKRCSILAAQNAVFILKKLGV